jgi:hypothetical protein
MSHTSEPGITADDFFRDFGEPLSGVLNLDRWGGLMDLHQQHARLEEAIREAVRDETEAQHDIREEIFPLLKKAKEAPPGAGEHQTTLQEIEEVQSRLLFSGAVEACDGSCDTRDTLPVTVHDISIALVSYGRQASSWNTRLFRRELCRRNTGGRQDAIELLERRAARGGLHDEDDDALSELARRGVMTFGERSALIEKAEAPWRMGQGSPAPLELIGAAMADMTVASIRLVRKLIENERFVFVTSEPRIRGVLTIAQALRPLEYAVIGTLKERLAPRLEKWAVTKGGTDLSWDGKVIPLKEWVRRLRDELAPRVVYGVYRSTPLAPPQVFYAHEKHVATAVRIAIADSVHRAERGFPLLLDMADAASRAARGGGLAAMADAIYAEVGAPFRYGSERHTRDS